MERLPLENHGLPLPFQHGDAALRNAGFHLLRTAAPELMVASHIEGGIGPAQSLDDGPGVLLRQGRVVVQNVASQQHQVGVLFLHQVQQLPLTLTVIAGVEIGEQHQPDGLGDLGGLHRVVPQGEAGIEGGGRRRDGRRCRQQDAQVLFLHEDLRTGLDLTSLYHSQNGMKRAGGMFRRPFEIFSSAFRCLERLSVEHVKAQIGQGITTVDQDVLFQSDKYNLKIDRTVFLITSNKVEFIVL